jgi:hypothetical protein
VTSAKDTEAAGAPKEIRVEGAVVRMRENGVVDVILDRNADVTVESSRAMNAAIHEFTDRPSPVLTDIREMRSTGILQMRYAKAAEVTAVTEKLAVLVASPVSRMIGNVFLGFAKPSFPTRLFTDEGEAIAWLLGDSEGTP